VIDQQGHSPLQYGHSRSRDKWQAEQATCKGAAWKVDGAAGRGPPAYPGPPTTCELGLALHIEDDDSGHACTAVCDRSSRKHAARHMMAVTLLLEPPGRRRKALSVIVAGGVVVSAWLLYSMAEYGIVSRPTGHHIEYVAPHFFAVATMLLYLLSTSASQLLSTHGAVKAFGFLALLSFGAAYVATPAFQCQARVFDGCHCLRAASSLLATLIRDRRGVRETAVRPPQAGIHRSLRRSPSGLARMD